MSAMDQSLPVTKYASIQLVHSLVNVTLTMASCLQQTTSHAMVNATSASCKHIRLYIPSIIHQLNESYKMDGMITGRC